MTAREQAALAVAHTEAALLDARKALRDAVKAEIAAMPELGDGEGFHAKVAALAVALGVPEIEDDADNQIAWWVFAPLQWMCLSDWHDGFRIEARCPTEPDRAEWRLSEHSLDAALRHALTWLADRDVFVEVRR